MSKLDLKNKSREELGKLLSDKNEALRNFRFALSGSKQKNVREGRNLGRDIARLKAEMSHEKYGK